MRVADRWDGADTPFRGERTLRLLALPAGARVLSARVRLEPASAPGAPAPFVERLSFDDDAPAGAGAARSTQGNAVEIDLRGRRTLYALEGTGFDGARLYADPGAGVFVAVGADGTLGAAAPLALGAGGTAALPGIAATRLRLVGASPEAPSPAAVLVRSAPSAVTLAVGSQPPFWAHPGELAEPAATGDFAPLLAAWLRTGEGGAHGEAIVPVVLRTDTLARFRVEVEAEVLLAAPLLPGGVRESAQCFDLASLALPPGGELSATLPAGARAVPRATRLRVRGAFDETRAVAGRGHTGVVDAEAARARALVSPDFLQAQEVPAGAGAVIVGVDLLLRPLSRAALLQVDLRGDDGGRPDRASLLPEAARVAVREGADPATAVWAGARFAAPLTIDPCRRYWLVLQAVEGEAEWVGYRAGTPAADRLVLDGGRPCPPAAVPPPPQQHSDDGGASWRAGAAMTALYRLRSRPAGWEVPIELEVGAGLDATRVTLERYAPLGRVDFEVDDDALADAVTRHAAASGGRCPPGEALADGAFAAWTAEGAAVGAAARVALGGDDRPLRVAASPDGRWAYLLALRGTAPYLARVDVPADVVVSETPLDEALGLATAEVSTALVAHPDGSRAYVAALVRPTGTAGFSLRVQAVDLERGRPAGPVHALEIAGSVGRVPAALSPDGTTLFLGGGTDVRAVDAALLERPPAVGAELASVVLDLKERVTALAPAPDGARLWIGTAAGDGPSRLHEAVLPGGAVRGSIDLPGAPAEVALTPDGAGAVVAHAAGVAVADLGRLALVPLSGAHRGGAEAVAVDATGTRAFAAGGGVLSEVRLDRRTVAPALPAGKAPADVGAARATSLALTPQGDRLYAAGAGGFAALLLGTRQLTAWRLETGSVRVDAPRTGEPRGVVLDGEDAVLAQEVAVTPGCRYRFAFRAAVSPSPDADAEAEADADAEAEAEVLWVGREDEPLEAVRVPIAENSEAVESAPLHPHRRLLAAPEGAARAEVRFRVRAGEARVAAASFAVTAERLANPDLRLPLRGEDGGWSTEGGAPAVVGADAAGGARLTGVGPAAAVVAQETEVEPGIPLALRLSGRAAAAPDGAVPAVRVRWRTEDGGALGLPVASELHPDDFETRTLRLDPPAGAARAEVALVLPARAAFLARRISLLPAPEVRVPLRFVARAPGELAVTAAEVVYDPGPAAREGGATPSDGEGGDVGGGLPGSGGAGGGAGGSGGGCGPTAADAAAAPAGTASGAALRMRTVPLAPPLALAGTRWAAPASVRAIVASIPPRPAGFAGTIAVRAVNGVGEVREARLVAAGIDSAERLAAATAAEVIRADRTLSVRIAESLIAAAARLVEERAGG